MPGHQIEALSVWSGARDRSINRAIDGSIQRSINRFGPCHPNHQSKSFNLKCLTHVSPNVKTKNRGLEASIEIKLPRLQNPSQKSSSKAIARQRMPSNLYFFLTLKQFLDAKFIKFWMEPKSEENAWRSTPKKEYSGRYFCTKIEPRRDFFEHSLKMPSPFWVLKAFKIVAKHPESWFLGLQCCLTYDKVYSIYRLLDRRFDLSFDFDRSIDHSIDLWIDRSIGGPQMSRAFRNAEIVLTGKIINTVTKAVHHIPLTDYTSNWTFDRMNRTEIDPRSISDHFGRFSYHFRFISERYQSAFEWLSNLLRMIVWNFKFETRKPDRTNWSKHSNEKKQSTERIKGHHSNYLPELPICCQEVIKTRSETKSNIDQTQATTNNFLNSKLNGNKIKLSNVNNNKRIFQS